MQPLTDRQAEELARWRGYSPAIVSYLREKQLVGMHEGCIAFATTGGCHYRVKDGSWRYSEGAKPDLFVLGSIDEGDPVFVTESPWDCIAYADAAGERDNICSTRGAGNTRLAVDRLRNHAGTVYLIPQNDKPGRAWANKLAEELSRP